VAQGCRIASVKRMRSEFLALLRCPSCGSPRSLQLDATANDERETREGRLHCRFCQLERPVRDGVADLMLDPSPEVSAEAEGLERFALQMRQDGWDRTRVLSLPYDESGYWWAQRQAMEHLLQTVPFTSRAFSTSAPTPAGQRPPSPVSACAVANTRGEHAGIVQARGDQRRSPAGIRASPAHVVALPHGTTGITADW
jgi:uncharacterized protein YbaR (Trm112 family)